MYVEEANRLMELQANCLIAGLSCVQPVSCPGPFKKTTSEIRLTFTALGHVSHQMINNYHLIYRPSFRLKALNFSLTGQRWVPKTSNPTTVYEIQLRSVLVPFIKSHIYLI